MRWLMRLLGLEGKKKDARDRKVEAAVTEALKAREEQKAANRAYWEARRAERAIRGKHQ